MPVSSIILEIQYRTRLRSSPLCTAYISGTAVDLKQTGKCKRYNKNKTGSDLRVGFGLKIMKGPSEEVTLSNNQLFSLEGYCVYCSKRKTRPTEHPVVERA